MRFKIFLQILLFVMPWAVRRPLLNFFLNYKIYKGAKIGYSIILPNELIMMEKSLIGNFVLCKNIDKLLLEKNAQIGNLNFITGFSTKNRSLFPSINNRKCELIINEHSHITSRHFLDCNGGIYIGRFTIIAGIRTQLLTHSVDFYNNTQTAESIIIGEYCFVSTGCIILKGSRLPDFSILGAGSVLVKELKDNYALYAGNPAKFIKTLPADEIKYFSRANGYIL